MVLTTTRVIFLLCTLVWLTTAVGCVTKGTYEDVEKQRDSVQAERDDLAAQLSAANMEVDKLRIDLEATETEVVGMRGTYDDLVAELQTEVAAGQVQLVELLDGVRLNVSDELLFPSGSAKINADGRAVLERVAGQIAGDESIVSVEGHTDNVGISKALQSRFPSNWELAAARASSVVRLLSENGVEPTRLRAVSRGPFAPIASNDTAEGRAKNRRTEIILRPLPN